MSDYESHRGKITKVQTELSCEEFAKEIYTSQYREEKPSYCKDYVEALLDETEGYTFYNGAVYIIDNTELDPEDDEFYYNELDDNSIEYSFRFYNGGTCLSEQIIDVLSEINNKGEN